MVTIKDSRKAENRFEELDIGEYFVYEGDLYVVIAETIEKEFACDNYCDSDVANALDLKNGMLYRIHEETVVAPVDVEITIF